MNIFVVVVNFGRARAKLFCLVDYVLLLTYSFYKGSAFYLTNKWKEDLVHNICNAKLLIFMKDMYIIWMNNSMERTIVKCGQKFTYQMGTKLY